MRRRRGLFYTPPFLVNYIISQTIDPFLENNFTCKVLDPSCGSGIFLVETLRKIIEKNIEKEETKQLSDDKLKNLLKENIFGIDIDENAINIAIFSLYITLLDYKEPKEIENFTFPANLKKTNFFVSDFFATDYLDEKLKDIQFDFIIGNPPWRNVNKEQNEYINY